MFSSTVAAGDNILATQYNNLRKDANQIGNILFFAGNQFQVPDGWLLCDGSAINRSTYVDLFTILSTVFGVGDGSSTFNLPDLEDRFTIGKSATRALGTTGNGKITLSLANLPSHTHSIGDPSTDHTHSVTMYDATGTTTWQYSKPSSSGTTATIYTQMGFEHDHNGVTSNYVGSNNDIDIIPSYIALNSIIKYGITNDVSQYDQVITSQYNNLREEGCPLGSISMYTNSSIPSGWLLCDGSEVSRTTYSELFDLIGETFGVGDGSTTFNLPDISDKFIVGKSSTYAMGSTGGGSFSVTADNMPTHNHTISSTSSEHYHSFAGRATSGTSTDRISSGGTLTGTDQVSSEYWSHTHTCGSEGSGTAVTILPVYLALAFIIKY